MPPSGQDLLQTPSMQIPKECIVIDTETTGFDPAEGDRMVEIGAVRMRGGLPTRETIHLHINPDRLVPESAVKVHGLTSAFLADKPRFHEVAEQIRAFIGDLPLVAHNAKFDAQFLNHEFRLIGLPQLGEDRFIDTVQIARRKFPGSPASLDALCRRFKISLEGREKHGALIDAELLAEVCVELMGGRQSDLFGVIEVKENETRAEETETNTKIRTFVRRATEAERRAHQELVITRLGQDAPWTKILSQEPSDGANAG